MVYLIDTQILIWFQLDSNKLKSSIKSLLIDSKNTILVSQISLFEIAIKQRLGKLNDLDKSIEDLVKILENDRFNVLNLDNSHLSSYCKISLFEEHRDPFDRLIIATALTENIALISADENFKLYKTVVELVEA